MPHPKWRVADIGRIQRRIRTVIGCLKEMENGLEAATKEPRLTKVMIQLAIGRDWPVISYELAIIFRNLLSHLNRYSK